MTKEIIQFGFKFLDQSALIGKSVLDCRIIKNPYSKHLSDEAQKAIVKANPLFEQLVKEGLQLLSTHDTVYVGCLFGRHRSGAVADELSRITSIPIKKI